MGNVHKPPTQYNNNVHSSSMHVRLSSCSLLTFSVLFSFQIGIPKIFFKQASQAKSLLWFYMINLNFFKPDFQRYLKLTPPFISIMLRSYHYIYKAEYRIVSVTDIYQKSSHHPELVGAEVLPKLCGNGRELQGSRECEGACGTPQW